jgi:hypothetical protein
MVSKKVESIIKNTKKDTEWLKEMQDRQVARELFDQAIGLIKSSKKALKMPRQGPYEVIALWLDNECPIQFPAIDLNDQLQLDQEKEFHVFQFESGHGLGYLILFKKVSVFDGEEEYSDILALINEKMHWEWMVTGKDMYILMAYQDREPEDPCYE